PALLALAAVVEVRAHQQQSRELALAAGCGLQADRVETRHLAQDLLQLPLELERALRGLVFGERMEIAKAGQSDDPLVDARVVLHRAGAERVEAGVDAEVARRELGEVTQYFRLGELRQPRRRRAGERRRNGRDRQVGPWHTDAAAPRLRLLVDQLHAASTSTSRSISCVV